MRWRGTAGPCNPEFFGCGNVAQWSQCMAHAAYPPPIHPLNLPIHRLNLTPLPRASDTARTKTRSGTLP